MKCLFPDVLFIADGTDVVKLKKVIANNEQKEVVGTGLYVHEEYGKFKTYNVSAVRGGWCTQAYQVPLFDNAKDTWRWLIQQQENKLAEINLHCPYERKVMHL